MEKVQTSEKEICLKNGRTEITMDQVSISLSAPKIKITTDQESDNREVICVKKDAEKSVKTSQTIVRITGYKKTKKRLRKLRKELKKLNKVLAKFVELNGKSS